MTTEPLARLPNLGPKSAAWLADVGIRDIDTLRQVGLEEALRRLIEAGLRPSLNLAYALHAGLEGRHWQSLDAAERSALILTMDSLRAAHRDARRLDDR
ncbi:MAG: TfoX/Sxy family protein [Rhodocyclaceae bacterium]|nr:TfoX/Sxy family protein [Rhodocyclaceae bacterium]